VRYQVKHHTTYEYDHPVAGSHHLLRLTPRPRPGQVTVAHELRIDPEPAVIVARQDYFGNTSTFITLEVAHERLNVTASATVEVTRRQLPAPPSTPSWESIRDRSRSTLTDPDARAASEFAFSSPYAPARPEFLAYASLSFPNQCPVLVAAADLMRRVHAEFKFDTRATTVATPLEQVLRQRRGVCQDFAHFQIACLRSLGLPARYVSGYLETLPPSGQERLVGADASHAWVQIWCGNDGWVDLDPTNNLLPNDRHITLAWGRDFGDVSPLSGVLVGSGRHRLKVGVDVVPSPASDQPLENPANGS
jgi:transglutaminase-like putative cysteine protease